MKFSLPKKELTRLLDKTSMALPTRSTSNILMGLLIEIDDTGNMKITGSDNEIRIEQTVQVTDYEAGRVVLPGKLFVDIIRSMPDEEISVSCGEDKIASVTTSTSSFRISSIDADEYPVSDPYIEDKSVKINKETFIKMIAQTTFAASKVDSRGVIVGALFDIKTDEIIIVSLDGFRMAIARTGVSSEGTEPSKIIIAARILNEIVKLIASPDFDEEEIEICYNESKRNAMITAENTRITISLIKGSFLNYENILPRKFLTEAVLDKEEFRHSVERAALMSTDGRNNLVRLKFTENELKIMAKSDTGILDDSIPVSLTGPEIEIGFNAKYVIDGLKAIDSEKIIFRLDSSIRPCTICPEDGEYIYMILPVRIS